MAFKVGWDGLSIALFGVVFIIWLFHGGRDIALDPSDGLCRLGANDRSNFQIGGLVGVFKFQPSSPRGGHD